MNKNLCLNNSEKEWLLKVKSILSKPQPPIPMPPSNEIWYRSIDKNIVNPNKSDVFGAGIVSNVYENGVGIITFDGDVTSIGNQAFDHCTSLSSITIPNSVISIGGSAFNSCSGLTSVTIGNSVTSIGSGAFNSCSGLTSITSLNTTPPTLGNSSTLPYHKTYTIYVPSESVEAYKAKQYWSNKASQIQAIQ